MMFLSPLSGLILLLSFAPLLLPSAASVCNVTLLPAALPSSVYTSTSCMWNGFDFTPLASVDLFGTDSKNLMNIFRLCGAVSDPTCAASTSPASQSQLCQYGNNAAATPVCSPITTVQTLNANYNFSFINTSNPVTGGVQITAYPNPAGN